jgi:hypothetical protein
MVRTSVGLEVADTPDAGPDGIPSSQHTAAGAIRFSPEYRSFSAYPQVGIRSQVLDLLGCLFAEHHFCRVECVLQTIPKRLDHGTTALPGTPTAVAGWTATSARPPAPTSGHEGREVKVQGTSSAEQSDLPRRIEIESCCRGA